jgi:hypothetical protein
MTCGWRRCGQLGSVRTEGAPVWNSVRPRLVLWFTELELELIQKAC